MPISDLTTRAANAFEELHRELSQFAPASRSRGRVYHRDGRVSDLQFGPGCVSAVVRGTRRYKIRWELNGADWFPGCTCPVAPDCKHSYAVALELLESAQSGPGISIEDIEQLLARAKPRAAPGTRPAPAWPGIRVAAPAPAPRRDALAELRAAKDTSWRLPLVARLLHETGLSMEPALYESLGEIIEQPDVDVMCWALAQELSRWTAGRIPAGLKPYCDRADLAARAAVEVRQQLHQHLASWAARRSHPAARSLRLVLSLAPARMPGCILRVEPRVTTARMDDEPRAPEQLRQMQSQLRNQPGQLSQAHSELLDALVECHYQLQAMAYAPPDRIARVGPLARLVLERLPSPDVRWDAGLTGPEVERAGIVPGDVVRFETQPVRLLPRFESSDDGAEATLSLAVTWPDGRQHPLAHALMLFSSAQGAAERAFAVVCGGVLQPLSDSLPGPLLRLMLRTPEVRVPRHEAAPLVRVLGSTFPEGPQPLGSLTASHPVRAVVALALDEGDRLSIRVLAQTAGATWPASSPAPAGGHVFELAADGQWNEHVPNVPADSTLVASALAPLAGAAADADAPAAEDSAAATAAPAKERAWLHMPEPACVKPVLDWLHSTGARADVRPGFDAPWSVKLGPRTIATVADAWERRPAGVRWLGDRAVQALLGTGHVLRPRISAKRSGVDLLAVSAEWESELFALTDADMARLRLARTPWVRLSGGWARSDAAQVHDEAMGVLADIGIEPGAGEQTLSLWQLAQARPESLQALEQFGLDAGTVAAVQELRGRVASFDGLPSTPLPRGLTGELRPYQRQGLDFLAWTSSIGMGAVLADDMGLGKTVQALAWLLHLRASTRRKGPALVVCPASVVHNWEREAQQFAPGLRLAVLGRGAEREAQMRHLARFDLVITNYALLRRDAEAWRGQKLFAVIADEAQMIKNPAAAVSRAMCELEAEHRLALTGTPLENRPLDLWSIVQFVNPGYLGSERSFLQRFDRADAPPHARKLLSARLRPMLLRRLKRDVAPELPARIEERRDCEMTTGQRKLYLAELSRARAEVARMSATGVGRHKIEILSMLTRLRQICCHPQLAGGKASVGSGKFKALFELLEPLLGEGHKVLVFSQFVTALDLVRAEMKSRGIPHFLLTGATTDRRGVVRDFEECGDACAFLISLRAGGTGLNLTAASYVVLLDPWWNPAVEAQAIDRTHRIGQDRTVIAYRLLMQGTIEEKIWELQQRKAALVADVLGEDGFAKALDREALEYLFAEE